MNYPYRVIIDNCVVSPLINNTGIHIIPIRALKRQERNLDINSIPKITTGSRQKDCTLLSALTHEMTYNQLIAAYQRQNLTMM